MLPTKRARARDTLFFGANADKSRRKMYSLVVQDGFRFIRVEKITLRAWNADLVRCCSVET